LVSGRQEFVLKGEHSTSVGWNREGPFGGTVAVEEPKRDLPLLLAPIHENDHVLSTTANDDWNETALTRRDRHWILVEYDARSDRLPKEMPSALRRCYPEVPVGDPSLHLERRGKGLKFNESYLFAWELDLNGIYQSSVQIEDLKPRLGASQAGGIDTRRDEKSA
jgi:hypothetical protein